MENIPLAAFQVGVSSIQMRSGKDFTLAMSMGILGATLAASWESQWFLIIHSVCGAFLS